MRDIYCVEGEWNTAYARELWLTVDRLAQAREDVVLDMSAVQFLDSQAVGAIVALMHRLKVKGLNLKIKGLSGQPRQLLFNLHLIPILECAR
jgi:anti-anti-sigma factor